MEMHVEYRNFNSSLSFPWTFGEKFKIRDGRGRTLEHWEVVGLRNRTDGQGKPVGQTARVKVSIERGDHD